MKGILKITCIEKSLLLFISDDGGLKQPIQSTKAHIKKWFCSSSLDQAKRGIEATWDCETHKLMTEDWRIMRVNNFLGGVDWQLSHHFC